MKQPAAPAGMPAARHSRSITWFSAATAPAPSSHDSRGKLPADTMVSIHTDATDGDSGMKARNRSLSRPMLFGATTWANRCHAPSSPSPASVTEPASAASSDGLSPITPTGEWVRCCLIHVDRTVGEIPDIAVVAVQQLDGVRRAHSGVTYAAVMPPSMINDWPVIQLDSLDARNSAPLAISVGSPKRPIGM